MTDQTLKSNVSQWVRQLVVQSFTKVYQQEDSQPREDVQDQQLKTPSELMYDYLAADKLATRRYEPTDGIHTLQALYYGFCNNGFQVTDVDIMESDDNEIIVNYSRRLPKMDSFNLVPLLQTLCISGTESLTMPFCRLTSLNLPYNRLGDDGAELLMLAVEKHVDSNRLNLRHLCLRSNDFTSLGALYLCKALMRASWTLEVLDLSENPEIGDEGCLGVIDLLTANDANGGDDDTIYSNMVDLDLGDTGAEMYSLITLCGALQANSIGRSIKNLRVDNPRLFTLQEEHIVHFGRMLRANVSIVYLSLGKMRIGDSCIKILVDYLYENSSIQELNLRCNQITSTGAVYLANLLAYPYCMLQILNLEANSIGDEFKTIHGSICMANALLQNNGSLVCINLDKNGFNEESCYILAQSIVEVVTRSATSKLREFIAFNNKWGCDGIATMYKIQKMQQQEEYYELINTDFLTVCDSDGELAICYKPPY